MQEKERKSGLESMEKLSDEHLALRVKEGDTNSFEELFLRYRDFMFAYILNMVRDYHLAEDLFQETFMKAFSRINTFNGQNFRIWLFSIARHLIIDYWKKASVRRRHPFLVLEGMDFEDPAKSTPLKQCLDAETLQRVSEHIERLPPKLREPLILHSIMGMDYEEISKLLNLNPRTLKVRVFRARLKLAKMLEGK